MSASTRRRLLRRSTVRSARSKASFMKRDADSAASWEEVPAVASLSYEFPSIQAVPKEVEVRRQYRSTVATPVPTREIEAMLTAFAGPPEPVARTTRGSVRRGGRRTIVLVAAALLVLVVSVPALALHAQLAETIRQFLGSRSQPD